MKKVLIVFNHPAPYKVRLFNELAKTMDLSVIFERGHNKNRSNAFYSETDFKFNLIKVCGLKIGDENFVSSAVKNHIKKNEYDLIVMNGYSQFAEMKAIRFMQKHEILYALFINGGIINSNESHWKKNLKTSYISKAKFYLSPDAESNKYLTYYGAKESAIFNYPYSTVYNHEIAEKQLDKEGEILLREKYQIEGEKVFVSAGQLIKRKNYQTLIESWKDMPKDHHLYIFGDGKEHAKYSKIIEDLQVKNVHLRSFLPKQDLFNVFRVADVFIFPSNEDIYGHVINESLSQGLPVISNLNVNSAKKLLSEKTGVLTNDFSASNILACLKQIEEHTSFKSCTDVAKQNTIEKMSESISKILLEN